MKIHFRYKNPEMYGSWDEKTACGEKIDRSNIVFNMTSVWKNVTCKNCLKKQKVEDKK